MTDRIDYRQFVSFLKNQVRLQATTNLFMVTDDHHSVWIALRKGMIESVFYGPRKGVEALGHIARISGGTLKQNPELDFPDTPGLPPTEVILRQLDLGGSAAAPAQKSALGAANKPQNVTDGTPPIAPDRLEQIVASLQSQLQKHLGPIAAIVVNKLRKRYGEIRTVGKLDQFIDELTTEVEGIGDHEAFRAEAKKLIGS